MQDDRWKTAGGAAFGQSADNLEDAAPERFGNVDYCRKTQ
jgi:hypothetical protein